MFSLDIPFYRTRQELTADFGDGRGLEGGEGSVFPRFSLGQKNHSVRLSPFSQADPKYQKTSRLFGFRTEYVGFVTLIKGNCLQGLRVTQKISPVNENEVAWIEAQLKNAVKFVERYSEEDAQTPLSLSALDRAFAKWMGSGPTETDSVNAVINYVGIAFGKAIVDGLGLTWVIATDDQGSELALYGFPGRGDVLIYPANFVAKRWEQREINFLENSYQQIARDVRAVFSDWELSN